MKHSKRGWVVYKGKSKLDGKPIVGIITRFSANRKTGAMDQLWILRKDINPLTAVKTGGDVSVCGDCKHRPALGGTCYVKVFQAPNQVWKTYKAGRYEDVPFHQISSKVFGGAIRLGAYGDPAALPVELLLLIVKGYRKYTGYTHQWKRFPTVGKLCMASTDNLSEYLEAKSLGMRSFRVTESYDTLQNGEIICPSDKVGLTCIECGLCDGNNKAKAKDIVIQVHGARKNKFKETVPSNMVMGA